MKTSRQENRTWHRALNIEVLNIIDSPLDVPPQEYVVRIVLIVTEDQSEPDTAVLENV